MLSFAPGSYRDRDARVFTDSQGEIWRGLSQKSLDVWTRFESRPLARDLKASGRLVGTAVSTPTEVPEGPWAGYLRHERIPLVTYPFEWPFSMLKQAARLHLQLLQELLAEDFTLKDGTAYNVQFRGVDPVFIDVASIDDLDATRPWAGYRQFCQTQLLPLMLQAYKDVPFHPWLRGRLDGITPSECSRLMSFRDLFRRGVWSHVKLHGWLESSSQGSSGSQPTPGFNREMLAANFCNLARVVEGLEWKAARSEWSEYEGTHTYSPSDRQQKELFVRQNVARQHRSLVWDLGCNTGTFSRIAAEHADLVVAMDADHLSVERLFRSLQSEPSNVRQRVLPLVWNVADQIGGLGWRGHERTSLVERGRPDLILCLALIHHWVISCGIPLTEVLEWLAGLGAELIIEFVDPSDSMAAALLNRRQGSCPDYTRDHFDREMRRLFEVRSTLSVCGGQRVLVQAVPRTAL
jgi:hypothetical protein